MRFRFFTVGALPPTAGGVELNASCAQHRIALVDKQFVDQGGHSQWLFWGCASRGERCGVRGAPFARVGAQPQAEEGRCFAVFVSVRALSSPAGALSRRAAARRRTRPGDARRLPESRFSPAAAGGGPI